MALSGSLWLSLWPSLALSGSLSGSLWLLLALSGSLWLSIALRICLQSPCLAHKTLARLAASLLRYNTLSALIEFFSFFQEINPLGAQPVQMTAWKVETISTFDG